MGGRGAASITGKGMQSGKPLPFYDRTNQFQGMTLHEFENAIRDRKTEFIGIFDKDGKLIIAGTSNRKGEVAIPEKDPRFADIHTLTHNHPYGGDRGIGGTFSEADVINHADLKIPGETRAVSNGPRENTYIIRTRKGSTPDYTALSKYATKVKRDGRMNKISTKAYTKAQKQARKKGKTIPQSKRGQIMIGSLKKIWKVKTVQKAGFEYIEVKEKHW